MAGDLYLGYRDDDAKTPFGKFFTPEMAPLPSPCRRGVEHGLQGGMALLAFDDAARVADDGYQQTENGYGVLEDGGYHVSVRTECRESPPPCGPGGSAGTGATRVATSCGTRGRTFAPPGRTEDDDAGGGRPSIHRALVVDQRVHRLDDAQWRNPIRRSGEDGLPPDSDDAVAIVPGWAPMRPRWTSDGSSTTSGRPQRGRDAVTVLDGRTAHRGAQRPRRRIAGGAPDRVAVAWQCGDQRSQSDGALRPGDESPVGLPAGTPRSFRSTNNAFGRPRYCDGGRLARAFGRIQLGRSVPLRQFGVVSEVGPEPADNEPCRCRVATRRSAPARGPDETSR